MKKNFPNGFTSWIETYCEVVCTMKDMSDEDVNGENLVTKTMETKGTGGFYELSEQLTDEFETLNKDREWDGEFFDELEEFLSKKLELNEDK